MAVNYKFQKEKTGRYNRFHLAGMSVSIVHLGIEDPWKIPVEYFRKVRYPYCKEVRKYACEEDVEKSNYVAEGDRQVFF